MTPVDELAVGEVGFVVAGIKNVKDTRVGDTITDAERPAAEPLPGYRQVNPMVFCGLYPVDTTDYDDLREALEKLELNDASLRYEPETSDRPGLRFSLRISRPAAHGDHPGADRAGIQHSAHHHGAERGLPGDADQRRSDGDRQPVEYAGAGQTSTTSRSRMSRRPSSCRTITSGRSWSCARASAASSSTWNTWTQPRHAHVRDAAVRDRLRLLRPAQIEHARAMLPSTTS